MIRPAEELGSVLSGRFEAEELRARIEAELAAGVEVVVSFEGVVAISPSFADELFAKVPEDAIEEGRVHFVDLDEDCARSPGLFEKGAGVRGLLAVRRRGDPGACADSCAEADRRVLRVARSFGAEWRDPSGVRSPW